MANNTSIAAAIEKAKAEKLWGTVSLKFKNGVAYCIETTISQKIEGAPHVDDSRK